MVKMFFEVLSCRPFYPLLGEPSGLRERGLVESFALVLKLGFLICWKCNERLVFVVCLKVK
jgi:hypothetical protein